MINFKIENRFTGKVQFIAEIEATENAPRSFKIALAVKWAVKNKANLRDADLRDADLSYADLSGTDLRGADLSYADLRGTDLSGTDLSGADLRGTDLRGTDLRGTDLRGTDLRGTDLSDAPKITNIHQTIYKSCLDENAFDMDGWGIENGARCGTTMCRAGQVINQAGEEGYALSIKIGIPAAALSIYAASDADYFKKEGIPDFYCGNEEALADMKRLAEKEAAK